MRRSWRLGRGWLLAGVLAVVPGVLALEPVAAEPGQAPPPAVGQPQLNLPKVEPVIPGMPTETEGALSVPEDWDAGVSERAEREPDEFAPMGAEVVEARDAVTEVFENTDGTETVKIHSEPINYQPEGATVWEPIDNTIVADAERPGWVRNAANDWTVRFGPITAGGGGGVEIATDSGTARFAPETSAGAAVVVPVVGTGDEADTVTYNDVWPGVDVRYTVSNILVKEEIVVTDGLRAEYPFVVEGLGLVESAPAGGPGDGPGPAPGDEAPSVDPPTVTGPLADTMALAPLAVSDGEGEFTGASGADVKVEPLTATATAPTADPSADEAAAIPQTPAPPATTQRLVVSVDEDWLADQADGPEPVVVDPIVFPDRINQCSYNTSNYDMCDAIRVGQDATQEDQHEWWRGVAQFNYQPHVQTKDVLAAAVLLDQSENDGSSDPSVPMAVNIWDASGLSFSGALHETGDSMWLVDSGVTSNNGCLGRDICLDVTDKLQQWQLRGVFHGWWGGLFGFNADEDDPDFPIPGDYKRFPDPVLIMQVNGRPGAPTLVAPQNNVLAIDSTTPTLSWNTVTDPDGDAVTYTAKIATGTDGESGMVASSPDSTATSWTVPEGVLQDGVTYYWKVFANDTNKAHVPSEVRKITVDKRLGAGSMSPTDSFGGVTTNLVTGNVALNVAAPDLPSIGGGVGIDFTYNGQRERRGLVGTYREDIDKDRVIEDSDPRKMVRTDPQVSFDWTKGKVNADGTASVVSDPPTPGMPQDWYSVRWSGFITLPANNDWAIGARSDDGVRIRMGEGLPLILDKWVDRGVPEFPDYETGDHQGGMTYPISIDYYESVGGATVQLWARTGGIATVVPASWLTPDRAEMPDGWATTATDMNALYVRAQVSDGSVTLTGPDGSTYSFSKNPGSNAYKPPEGIEDVLTVNWDGKVTVHDDEGYTYVFRADGGLDTITAAVDDRKPAAATNTFDSLGRLSTLRDPVSTRQVVFSYGRHDTNCPNDLDASIPDKADFNYNSAAYGLLCAVMYPDGTSTRLYYKNGQLGYIRNPGDAYWAFSYNAEGRLEKFYDPTVFDAIKAGARTDTGNLFTEIGYQTPPIPSGCVCFTKRRIASSVKAPLALPTDPVANRASHSYTLAPVTNASGVLDSGTATVTRAGVPGTYRSVGYDYRGRTTTSTNAAGQTSTTYWSVDDLQTGTRGPDGLMTATFYSSRKQPIDQWGPAPEGYFTVANAYGGTYVVPKPQDGAPGNAPPNSIPHSVTNYDEGLTGLQSTYWNNLSSDGPPLLHASLGSVSLWGDGSPGYSIGTDGWSTRLSGEIVFPTAGTYYLAVEVASRDVAALYINDQKVSEVWAGDLPPSAPTLGSASTTIVTGGANESRRIRIDFADGGSHATLKLNYGTPTNPWPSAVPGSWLKPGFGLVTSTIDADGKRTNTEYSDGNVGPQHGLATKTIVDPAGLALTETTKYETLGGGFLRRTERTLPAGAATKTTNTYYGNTEQRDNPCTTASDPANQGGMVKLDTSADPDAGGSQTPIVRENVYDKFGRVVAYRSGSGTLSATDWVCTTYDARGRATEVKYPAYGGEPARTVTNNYLVDPDGAGPKVASPLVTSVTDPAGTITTEADLVGRGIAYKDVFGNTTTFVYDLAGRETSNTGPVGTIAKTYDNADRLTQITRNGAALANGFVYDTNNSRLKEVTYPTGAGTAGNGTKGVFDADIYGRTSKITWTGPGAALLTSDEIDGRTIGGDVQSQKVDGVDHHAGVDYTYDAAGRLIDAWVPGRHVTYGYAGTGGCGTLTTAGRNTNRTSQAIEGGATTTYCYNNADRLTSVTGDATVGTIAYDSHGNTTSIYSETHSYDVADRHTKTVKGTTTVQYVRDATDRIVERRLNAATVARYGSTGSGDAPEFTTNSTNQVLEVTYALPGGAMLTTRAAGNVWSYPNSHGDVVAVANQTGAKQGATTAYDPFGDNIAGTLPDNSAGNLDYGWLGQHQRPLEHETNLQPIIEMGSRQYDPRLGRFSEVDPIEGGSANDYDYVDDPVNDFDLDGKCGLGNPLKKCGSGHKGGTNIFSGARDRVSRVCPFGNVRGRRSACRSPIRGARRVGDGVRRNRVWKVTRAVLMTAVAGVAIYGLGSACLASTITFVLGVTVCGLSIIGGGLALYSVYDSWRRVNNAF